MKILAIGAHFDDIELGCGGSLLKWSGAGNELSFYVATKSGYADVNGNIIRSNEDASKEGASVVNYIGAKLYTSDFETFTLESKEPLHKELLALWEDIRPDMILTHWEFDSHRDHAELSKACIHVFSRRARKILFYRSNWYLSYQKFDPRYFVDISKQLDEKIRIVKMFESEFKRTGGKWEDWLRAEAVQSGMIANCQFAEGFQILKFIE